MVSAVQKLEETFNEKRRQIEGLIAKKGPIENEISAIDAEIRQIIGDGRTIESVLAVGKRAKRKRVKNEKSLRVIVLEVLATNKQGATLANLADQIQATGYKSNSRNFRNVLYQCLYNTPKIKHDSATGAYKLTK